MEKHTPGPWALLRGRDGTSIVGVDVQVAYCYGMQEKENAILISAAPDLLEACKALVEKDLHDIKHFGMALAAIAKAEGRE